MTGSEQVLIEDWCQQYPSHSVGTLAFGADGALYVAGGDGASFNFADWGQTAAAQPVRRPARLAGDAASARRPPRAARCGARTSGRPATRHARRHHPPRRPGTGAGRPDNPLWSSPDPNARRIIANGSRNPFRFTIRPGTNEVWSGDVGWNTGRRSTASSSVTDAVSTTSGGPATRAPTGRQLRRRQPEHLREPLLGRAERRSVRR